MFSRWGLTDRPWLLWIVLLATGQAADVLTTRVDLARGAREANSEVVGLLHQGGFQLVVGVKMAMVVIMALTVLLVHRRTGTAEEGRGRIARILVWRGLQACVIALTLVSLNNVYVLFQIS